MKGFQMSDSMRVASVWVVWTFLAVGAVGWALMVVLKAFCLMDQAAPWVQAIGSVLAVVAAIVIFNADRIEGRKRERRKETVVLQAVSYMAADACSALGYLNDGLRKHFRPITDESPQEIRECVELVDQAVRELSSIDLFQMPDPEVVKTLITLKTILMFCRQAASPLKFHVKKAYELLGIINRKVD